MFSNESNLEILYQVLDMYTKEVAETLVVPPEFENYQFSERFERRMQRLIKMQRKSYYKCINTAAKRVACYVLVILTCMFVTVFSVKSLREPFISFVVETYEKFTSLFVEKDVPADNVEFEVMLPTYIPEGYEAEEPMISDTMFIITYLDELNTELTYSQYLIGGLHTTLDTEMINYEKVYINNLEGAYYSDKDTNCLVFGNGIYTFNITGQLSKEAAIKIAESIDIK